MNKKIKKLNMQNYNRFSYTKHKPKSNKKCAGAFFSVTKGSIQGQFKSKAIRFRPLAKEDLKKIFYY